MKTTRQIIRLAAKSLTVALALLVLTNAGRSSGQDAASASVEPELIAILQSDAPAGDKAIACKKLAIHGSATAVPELAKLLADPQLSSWARTALEAIPGSESDVALRTATESVEGRLLIGMLNSIGVRRDAGAVELLTARLQDAEPDVASAAAVALGRVGNDAATQSLRAALATAPEGVRSAVAEGCVLCAERLLASEKSADAAALYDEVRAAQVPQQRIIEATRGAILARGEAGIPLLLEQFRSPEKTMFQLALATAREFPGRNVDQVLATEMASAAPDRAALIIQAMADRPATVQLAAILKAAEAGPKPVRLSAIDALGRVGDDTCLASLLPMALDADADLAATARETLAELPGEKVDSQIVTRLDKAEGPMYPLLLELVGQRRIDAVPALLKAIDNRDKVVRNAALTALGETVRLQRLSVLISQVVAPKYREDAEIAQQALLAASVRMPDREACAAELTRALNSAPAGIKTTLLEILSEVAGTTALQTIGTAAKSNDPQLQDAGSRLLGKWNSVDAAPVLLDLAKTGPAAQYRIRALRGYLGLVRKFAIPDAERAEMCRTAFGTATQAAEQKLVLDVAKIHPSKEMLTLTIGVMKIPALKEDATEATLVIAQKLGSKGIDVKDMLAGAGLDKVKVEIVKAEYGSGATQKDVTAVLQKQAGDLPLITLTPASYNASFGGDPLPGSVKVLKVSYKINGRAGEASFPENAVIVLPMPK